ncbi:MAG: acyl carrier protein [Paracoccaceae bacterium]
MTVAGEVISIIARQAVLDPSEVRPDMALDDLGIDSLGLVEAIFAIEERFDISVPFNANEPKAHDFDTSTVATVIAGVERLIAGRN